jgi:hypothetical protein
LLMPIFYFSTRGEIRGQENNEISC